MESGIHNMLPREKMAPHVQKFWDFINRKPGAPFFQQEFGYYCMEKWQREDGLPTDVDLGALFGFDEPALAMINGLGGCEAALEPEFEVKVLEDRGDYELVCDRTGRSVLYFKGRRDGFMPEYVDHPVEDQKSFEEKILWRMDPASPSRQAAMDEYLPKAQKMARRGYVVEQYIVGGYMYLRSLIGPERLLYTFYDDPELVHACMKAWLNLADNIMARHQKAVSVDLILLDEDICYNCGSLISPDMIREFLMPYYQQLLMNARERRLDKKRPLNIHVGSDGFFDPVIPLYIECGMSYLSPFEVAAGSDVVRTGLEYPELNISGGIDKRVLATTKDDIDRMVDKIFPKMRARGGYIPTCDHGVPEEVPLENYMHYRKRCLEFA